MGIFLPLNQLNSFNNLISQLSDNQKTKSQILTTGIGISQDAHLISSVSNLKNSTLVITSDELAGKKIFDDLKFFSPNEVLFYPAKDIIFYNACVKSKDILKERFKIISKIINNEKITIVLSIDSLFDRLTPLDVFKNFILTLNTGMEISLDDLEKKLTLMGYVKRGFVEYEGQYSIRGGILDIFIPNDNNGYRIEFFGDEIDSIRILNISSQRSTDKTSSFNIFPVRELVFTDSILFNAIDNIKKDFKKGLTSFETSKEKINFNNLNNTFNEVIESLTETKTTTGLDSFINYFYSTKTSLLDYLHCDTTIFISNPNSINDSATTSLHRFTQSISDKISNGYMLPNQLLSFNSYEDIIFKIKNFNSVLLTSLPQTPKDFTPTAIIPFTVRETSNYSKISELIDDIIYYKKLNYKMIILCSNKHSATQIIDELYNKNIIGVFIDSFENKTLNKDNIYFTIGNINNGFEYTDLKLTILSSKSLLTNNSKNKTTSNSKRFSKKTALKTFSDLKVNDYIVHINHGIGIFVGIEKISTKGISKDYIKLKYKDDGLLFIPTDQMDLIQKFSSSDSAKPKLNKLGGLEWKKTQLKTKKAIVVLAEELIELYSIRQQTKGYQFDVDTVWQEDFENTFMYTETNDQLNAIADVKADMESPRLMDRLICGDVGYGKTEIALRACFKAIQSGKQVAYLVPTTILAQQHFNLFQQRIGAFSAKVSMLSRFNTLKQKKETKSHLKSGYCDVVIGTHALLSKDVEFKDLGLVIIDEEQRFGVTHKEKLKMLKHNVDVITLTATPIPRTLNMSLTGIKDMSLLEEPPVDRVPIQTYLLEFNEAFIKDAVYREISRSGQIYFLHNSVNTIDFMTSKLKDLLPDVKIDYAHGQMPSKQLENKLKCFIDKEFDLLVCTTIIETGLDISNVNTIIINNADTMGLSQLYQLRGRVGRSNRSAYCYLMYKKSKVISEIAEKRLKTIRDFTEFGSGFKIAMKDLEIRGSGSFLGMEQSGHINSVGYDMYCMLLDNAVKELKGEKVVNFIEANIDIKINAYIPHTYIDNETHKLEVYKKISLVHDLISLYSIEEEIEDRYGTIPKPLANLLKVANLKFLCNDIGISSVSHKDEKTIIIFNKSASINVDTIIDLQKNNRIYKFVVSDTPTLFIGEVLKIEKLLLFISSIHL